MIAIEPTYAELFEAESGPADMVKPYEEPSDIV